MSATPRTTAVLDQILQEHGLLNEETAPKRLVQLGRDLECDLRGLVQAAYNLSMFLRESVAPHDAGQLKDDWPLVLATNDIGCAERLKCFLQAQEETLAALGYPVRVYAGGAQ